MQRRLKREHDYSEDNPKPHKVLLPRYEGKVKCVYIDPPHNTGNTSVTEALKAIDLNS